VAKEYWSQLEQHVGGTARAATLAVAAAVVTAAALLGVDPGQALAYTVNL
jgi:methyl coenzyme M reductase alpha subunit